MHRRLFGLTGLVCVFVACDRNPIRQPADAGAVDPSAPAVSDAGPDAGESTDSGQPLDGGALDASVPAVSGAGPDAGESADSGQPLDGGATTRIVTFPGSTAVVTNPERGFLQVRDLPSVTDPNGVPEPMDFSDIVAAGETLVLGYVRLDPYRETPIPDAFLAQLQGLLDTMRAAGLSTVLRFAYNRGPWPNTEPDASETQILTHIAQLTPLLQQNADIITTVEAGFIGAWGEWDDSTNGLLDDPQTGLDIATALLNALPVSRSVLFRTPLLKQAMFGGPATAFDASFTARSGHHNDCFLASDTDEGTYPAGDTAAWESFVASDALFVPLGGETCLLNPPRSDCTTALSEMTSLHDSFLNGVFSPDVIAAWQAQGCYDEINLRLGYRFLVDTLEVPTAAQAGLPFTIRIALHNEGFAAPFNERPPSLVLSGPTRIEVPLDADPRTWRDAVELTAQVTIPSDGAGSYAVALWLPSPDMSLRSNPAYAIRLPNATWDATTGLNVLGMLNVSQP